MKPFKTILVEMNSTAGIDITDKNLGKKNKIRRQKQSLFNENTSNIIKLDAKTIESSLTKKEIKALLPAARIFKKKYVAAVGYVLYVLDESGKTIAQVTKDKIGLSLYVKA